MSNRMRNIALSILLLLFAGPVPAPAQDSGVKGKPRAPLAITIAPVRPGTVSEGAVVPYQVTVRSAVEAPAMTVKVTLADGAKLASGNLAWSGPVRRNEDVVLNFSVQVPAEGSGKIRAQARIAVPGKQRTMVRQTQHSIVTGRQHLEQVHRSATARPVKQDARGRAVVEY